MRATPTGMLGGIALISQTYTQHHSRGSYYRLNTQPIESRLPPFKIASTPDFKNILANEFVYLITIKPDYDYYLK